MNFVIGGIGVAALVFGIVEAAKQFGVSGRGCQVLALMLGFIFVGTSQAITNGIIPPAAVQYVELVVTALAGGLAAMGYYDFIKARGIMAAP